MVLKGKNEWYEYVKSGQKPGDIPYDPHKAYKDKWVSWPDWVGTVGTSLRPFEEARAFAQTLELDRFRACRWAEV